MMEFLGLIFGSLWVQITIALSASGLGLYFLFKQRQKAKKLQLEAEFARAGTNVVVLHHIERGPTCPNPSPFPIKLETYLRMTGIKYVTDFKAPMSSKGKTPWITINGQEVADSQLAIDFLNKTLEKSPSGHLDRVQRAQARSFRIMLEDHFYWAVALGRWVYDDLERCLDYFAPFPVPKFVSLLFLRMGRKNIRKSAQGHGMGRHTREEVERLGMEDLRALSDFLGDKPFLMGDEPCEEDCSVFGFLCMPLYCAPKDNVYRVALQEELVNLVKYTERMQKRFWPDWEEARWKK